MTETDNSQSKLWNNQNSIFNKSLLNKQLIITSIILFASMFLFEMTNIDLIIQEYFYDFKLNEWIISRDNAILKLIFYDGIKIFLIVFAVAILIVLISCRKKQFIQNYKKGLLIVVISAVAVPSIIGGLKMLTNTPCPKNIINFNGCYPYVKVFTPYPPDFHQKEKIECFPAGHASGGFALLSMFFLFKKSRNRTIALLSAIAVGWSMGIYKMLIGDHFLSHTVITMILSWLTILIVVRFVVSYPFIKQHNLN